MQPTAFLLALLPATLTSASALLPRANEQFSGRGQIRVISIPTGLDSGCLTASAQWTTTESECGTYTGTLTPNVVGIFSQADLQSSSGGYLGQWDNNNSGILTADHAKPGDNPGSRFLSLWFAAVEEDTGVRYLGTGYVSSFATWGSNPPAKGETSQLETSKSNTPAPSYNLGWKAL